MLEISRSADTKQIIEILRRNLAQLRSTFGVKKVGLFGSAARDQLTAESDIDLVIEFDAPLGWRFMDLADHLETLLGRRVDILTPSGLKSIHSPEVRQNIQQSVVYV